MSRPLSEGRASAVGQPLLTMTASRDTIALTNYAMMAWSGPASDTTARCGRACATQQASCQVVVSVMPCRVVSSHRASLTTLRAVSTVVRQRSAPHPISLRLNRQSITQCYPPPRRGKRTSYHEHSFDSQYSASGPWAVILFSCTPTDAGFHCCGRCCFRPCPATISGAGPVMMIRSLRDLLQSAMRWWCHGEFSLSREPS